MKKCFLVMLLFILLFPSFVFASSGSLKAATIKECEGTLYGQHGSDNHWHVAVKNENGGYSAKGEAFSEDPCPLNNDVLSDNLNTSSGTDNSNKIVVKNSDSTLKQILINDDEIEINDTMEYKTYEAEINLSVIATDSNAKVEYNNIKSLELGNNIVNITVTAEDNTKSKYVLIIVRQETLSDDISIEVKIDGEILEFNDYKTNFEVKNDVTSLDINYTLGNTNSKVEIVGNEDFVIGKNDVKLIVTAENGDIQEYVITVVKLDWFNSIIKVILGSSVVVAIIGFFKKFVK